jgi:uncharacterized protein
MLAVTARTPLFPTEDPGKVRGALLFIFPNGSIEETGSELQLRTEDVSMFMDIIRRSRILDAARSQMRHGMAEGRTTFFISKQVAAAGHLSLAEGKAPLGVIEVTIESDDIEKAIDRIAPMRVDGEEVVQ